MMSLASSHRSLDWVVQFWPALVVSVPTSLCATALCRMLAVRWGIVDRPDDLV